MDNFHAKSSLLQCAMAKNNEAFVSSEGISDMRKSLLALKRALLLLQATVSSQQNGPVSSQDLGVFTVEVSLGDPTSCFVCPVNPIICFSRPLLLHPATIESSHVSNLIGRGKIIHEGTVGSTILRGPLHFDVLASCVIFNLGLLHHAQGRIKNKNILLESAAELYERSMGPLHQATKDPSSCSPAERRFVIMMLVAAHINLADTRFALGDQLQAMASLGMAAEVLENSENAVHGDPYGSTSTSTTLLDQMLRQAHLNLLRLQRFQEQTAPAA